MRRFVVVLSLILASMLSPAPVSAVATVSAPFDIIVSQENLTVSAEVLVDDGTEVEAVTVTVGSAAAVTLRADSSGMYNKLLTLADAGKTVIFRATASAVIGGQKVVSEWFEADPYTFARTEPPGGISVSQDGFDLTADVQLADDTLLSKLEMKIGFGYFTALCDSSIGDECTENPYTVTISELHLGKLVTFRATAASAVDNLPDSVSFTGVPFTFAQSSKPTSVKVSQHDYELWIDVAVPANHVVQDVIITSQSEPEGYYADLDTDHYVYTLNPEDIGHIVRISVNALTTGLVASDPLTASITPAIAATPRIGVITQTPFYASTVVAIATGSTATVEAAIDGSPRTVIRSGTTAKVALTPDDAGKTLVFFAVGNKPQVPSSDPVFSNEYVIQGTEPPTAASVSMSGTSICVLTTVQRGQTVGEVTATVNNVRRTVVLALGKRCVVLARTDVGKTVVFNVRARQIGKVDSEVFVTRPYAVAAATKPVIRLTQTGLLVSATVTLSSGHRVGTVTGQIGTKAPVPMRIVRGKYVLPISKADVGKRVVVRSWATALNKYPSLISASSPLLLRK